MLQARSSIASELVRDRQGLGLLLENCRGASHAPVRRVGAKWQAPRANAVQHGGRTGHAREDVGTFAGLGAGFSILSGRDTFNRGGRSALNTVNTTLTKDQLDQITGFFMTGNGPYFISPSVIGPRRPGSRPGRRDPVYGATSPNACNHRRRKTGVFQPRSRYARQPATALVLRAVELLVGYGCAPKVRIMERQSIQFRAEAFNVFNQPSFLCG